jgi:excisionase family DNA binding protein
MWEKAGAVDHFLTRPRNTEGRRGPNRKDHPMNRTIAQAEALLSPSEVATLFRVDPKTVTRWAQAGKLTCIRTLGGHRRYREDEVRALLAGIPSPRSEQG